MENDIKQAFDNLEKLSRDNYKNLDGKLDEVKKDVVNLYDRDRETYKELTRIQAQADNTDKNLEEFKKSEKTYGIKTDKQLQRLDNMHWKVLIVGIALLSAFITFYQVFMAPKSNQAPANRVEQQAQK